jgi:hypothetical protein
MLKYTLSQKEDDFPLERERGVSGLFLSERNNSHFFIDFESVPGSDFATVSHHTTR